MPGRAALRFLLEVVFIVGVAAIAAASSLSVVGIVLVMIAAWLVVAGIEWAMGRSGAEPRAGGLRLRRRRDAETSPAEPQPAAAAAGEPHHVRVLGREPQPSVEASIPEPAAVQESGVPAAEPPVRVSEPVEGVSGEPGGSPADAAPEPPPAAAVLEVVPASVPDPQPQPEAEPAAAAPAAAAPVRTLPLRGPREWNLWDLERLTREHSGHDVFRDEERTYLLMYLRDFANADGILPVDFDGLVRDSFGDLVGAS
jgi:hypothetical protein